MAGVRVFVCALLVLTLTSLVLARQTAPQTGVPGAQGAPRPAGQRGGGLDPDTPRPIAAFDSVWIEDLTWMEVRDAIRSGKTTAIIPAGSVEQNGPYIPTNKHNYVLRVTCDAIARKLGNALVAPIMPIEVGDPERISSPGSFLVRQETFENFIIDEATALKKHGFQHIILLGDSGGDSKGLDGAAKKLSEKFAAGGPDVHFIPEYYDSWDKADASWDSLGVPVPLDAKGAKTSDGIHDDYSVNSIIAVLDPEKIRFNERTAARKDSINGQPISPISRTVANGKKLIDLRANLTVEAIKKALASK